MTKLIKNNLNSYLMYLSVLLISLAVLFCSDTMDNLFRAAALSNSIETVGTYDLSVYSPADGGLPASLDDRVEILSATKDSFSDAASPLAVFLNDFTPFSIEMIEGRLPESDGEVSVSINSSLTHNWLPGMVLQPEETNINQELTITGVHNSVSPGGDLLVFQQNLNQIPAEISQTQYFLRILDPALVQEIFDHPEQYSGLAQLSTYGHSRWGQSSQFSEFLTTVTALCLIAILFLLVLGAESFLRKIKPELAVLYRIGKSRSSLLIDQFIMVFVFPVLVCLILCGLLTVAEMGIWNHLQVQSLMKEMNITSVSFFMKLFLTGLVLLTSSALILWMGSILQNRFGKRAVKKALRGKSGGKNPIPFRFRKLVLTGNDWMMILFLALLFLSVPLVTVQSETVLEQAESPILELENKDMRIYMSFQDQTAQEIQELFQSAQQWAADQGRTGFMEIVGAVPLQGLQPDETSGITSGPALSNLTIPLNETIYEELTSGLNVPENTQFVFLVTKDLKPMNVLTITKSSGEYQSVSQITLDPGEVKMIQEDDYSLFLMNPDDFQPEKLSSSFQLVTLSVSWFFSEGFSIDEELQNARNLIAKWKPASSYVFLQKEIRESRQKYEQEVWWITIVSLIVIASALLCGVLLLFQQKVEGLHDQIQNARNIGLSTQRIRKDIRSTQSLQLLLSMIPSLIIGIVLWIWQHQPLWTASCLVTGLVTELALMIMPVNISGNGKKASVNTRSSDKKEERNS